MTVYTVQDAVYTVPFTVMRAVIVVGLVPALPAVTTPAELTVATVVLLELHVTLAPEGYVTAVIVLLTPSGMYSLL